LLPQGEVLEGELAVAAAQEREEPEQMEQEGDHRAGFSPDQSRLINYLAADGVLAKDTVRLATQRALWVSQPDASSSATPCRACLRAQSPAGASMGARRGERA